MKKPDFAMVGVEPETLVVQILGGWCVSNIEAAAKEGLITIRASWSAPVGLYNKLDHDQLMALSA